MSLPTSVRAIAFDMDGVLWLSTPVHAWAFRETLAGEDIRDLEYARYAGMTTKECLARVFRERGREVPPGRIAELAAAKNRLVLGALRRNPPVARECLRVVTELNSKYRLALASSASPATVELFMETSGCGGLFSVVLCGASVERPKPAPDIYVRTCELLSVPPENTLVVEDAIAGVAAGRVAGARVWALPTTSPGEALLEAGADRVIHGLEELL